MHFTYTTNLNQHSISSLLSFSFFGELKILLKDIFYPIIIFSNVNIYIMDITKNLVLLPASLPFHGL